MKLNYKNSKLLLSLAFILMTAVCSTASVKVDGIFYELNSDGTCSTTYARNSEGNDANYGSKVTVLDIPKNIVYAGKTYKVTSIGTASFHDLRLLKVVKMPNTITSIGDDAFSQCKVLESVKIPDNVLYIGEGAFNQCNKLPIVKIPASVAFIGEDAFYHCDALTDIIVDEENEYYKSVDGVLFNKDMTKLIRVPVGNERTFYEIPNTVKTIGYSSVSKCWNITDVRIPSSVTIIEGYAFFGTELKSLVLPESIVSIAEYAFQWAAITALKLPESLANIGKYAFEDCRSLKCLYIPGSIKKMGERIFEGCYELSEVYYNTDSPITANEDIFENEIYSENGIYSIYSKATLYVKESAIDEIRKTVPWNLFSKIEPYDFAQTGVDNVINKDNPIEILRFDLQGKPVSKDYKGIVVVKLSDGSSYKTIAE